MIVEETGISSVEGICSTSYEYSQLNYNQSTFPKERYKLIVVHSHTEHTDQGTHTDQIFSK